MNYELVGFVHYAVGSCHDDRSLTIQEKLKARTKAEAIKKARKKAERIHKENRHLTDYSMALELRIVTTEPLWNIHFEDEEAAREAIPARAARPARLVEQTL